jgi:hypothetical protein
LRFGTPSIAITSPAPSRRRAPRRHQADGALAEDRDRAADRDAAFSAAANPVDIMSQQ